MAPRHRRLAAILSALLIAGFALTACGSDDVAPGAADGVPGRDVLDNAKEKVTIEFWHAMRGANADAINALVAEFARSEAGGKVEVKPVYQGTYDDTIAKYKTAVQQNNT